MDRVRGMAAPLSQATRDSSLPLPEGSGLPHEEGAMHAGREEMRIVHPEIRAESRVVGPLDKFAATAQGDDLDIAHPGRKDQLRP